MGPSLWMCSFPNQTQSLLCPGPPWLPESLCFPSRNGIFPEATWKRWNSCYSCPSSFPLSLSPSPSPSPDSQFLQEALSLPFRISSPQNQLHSLSHKSQVTPHLVDFPLMSLPYSGVTLSRLTPLLFLFWGKLFPAPTSTWIPMFHLWLQPLSTFCYSRFSHASTCSPPSPTPLLTFTDVFS